MPGPFILGFGAVGAGDSYSWSRFDQVFYDKAVAAEETDPLTIGQLEIDLVLPLQPRHAKIVVNQGSLYLVRDRVQAEKLDRRRV